MVSATALKIESFFSQYRLRKYAKGQILILNGDTPEYIFNLVSGSVKQYDISYKGDELILNVFKPPAFFPMAVAVNKTTNPYIYEAETEIEIRQAPSSEVIDFIKSNTDVMYDLLSRVYRGTDVLLGRLTHLMSGSAKVRLMFELIVEALRSGELQKDGCYSISLNEKDLAARSGLSRETVNREIHKLKKDDLVKLSQKTIVICNIQELQKRIDFEL